MIFYRHSTCRMAVVVLLWMDAHHGWTIWPAFLWPNRRQLLLETMSVVVFFGGGEFDGYLKKKMKNRPTITTTMAPFCSAHSAAAVTAAAVLLARLLELFRLYLCGVWAM